MILETNGITEVLISGDRKNLFNCFSQLLDNANHAIKQKNEKFEPSLKVNVIVQNEECIIEFIDNGIGISETNPYVLLEPFKRGNNVNYIGTGLGLSIVKVTIAKHNGKIDILSQKGLTKFIIGIPIIKFSTINQN